MSVSKSICMSVSMSVLWFGTSKRQKITFNNLNQTVNFINKELRSHKKNEGFFLFF